VSPEFLEPTVCGSRVGSAFYFSWFEFGTPNEFNDPFADVCPLPPHTRLPDRDAAGLAGGRAAWADAQGSDDNNERWFYGWDLPDGGATFGPIQQGEEGTFAGSVTANIRILGHLHRAGGGNRLSQGSNMSGTRVRIIRDVERTNMILNELASRRVDVSNFVTILVTPEGDVLRWRGRNLSRDAAVNLGSAECQ
jgi:hypothetical protein